MRQHSEEASLGPGNMPAFAIGVTGHRDLVPAETGKTEEAVRQTLRDLAGRFAHMPVSVVTGLADGADTLVARVALELGFSVDAVLPMPAEIYEDDFSGTSLAELKALLADDRIRVIEIPMTNGRSRSDMSDPDIRTHQYGLLMDYIHRRSNVLLALWDGQDRGLHGGTGDVVLGYLGISDGKRPMEIPPGAADPSAASDVVIWIPVSRSSNPGPTEQQDPTILVANATRDCFWRQQDLPAPITSRWRGLDAYARERLSGLGGELPSYPLLPEDAADVSEEARGIENEYMRTDQLARANQRQSDRMFQLFGLLAAGMGFFFLVYAKLVASAAFLAIYIALFILGFVGFRVSKRNQWLAKHLSYRALAETLRVQFFLTVSGVGRSFDMGRILRLTNVNSFERFDWLGDAVRCCEPLVRTGHVAPDKAVGLVRAYWVEDQAAYFRKKLHAMHRRHERLELIKAALLIGSMLGALSLIFFMDALHHFEMAGHDGKAMLVFLMGLLPLWVAVWELYQGKMATRELIWQYANQERLFNAAAKPLQFAKVPADAAQVVTDLADKALIEIYLWSVHRYHREHEPPAAG